jgi:hypothetical protein
MANETLTPEELELLDQFERAVKESEREGGRKARSLCPAKPSGSQFSTMPNYRGCPARA